MADKGKIKSRAAAADSNYLASVQLGGESATSVEGDAGDVQGDVTERREEKVVKGVSDDGEFWAEDGEEVKIGSEKEHKHTEL